MVLYYPDKEIEKNILSYLDGLDNLIIWDNTPVKDQRKIMIDVEAGKKVIVKGKGRNVGIGEALNEAVRYGIENDFTHLLTMDQDSCFADNMFAGFVSCVKDEQTVAIASFSANTHPYDASQPILSSVDICITSGTIYSLSAFKEIGIFRDDFFIDAIDTEFCFRLRRNGWKMVQLNKIYMHHVLGNVTVTPFLWGKLISPNYSAQRTYYLVRNTLVLRKLYPEYSQAKGQFKTIFFWRPLCILFAEKDKWRKSKAMLKGIYHYLTGRLGEYTIR